MKRSQWPLYSFVTVTIFVLTGVVLWKVFVPEPLREPYDMKKLGLGSQSTVVIAMSTDCTACFETMEFYKSLMQLPEVDGAERRVVAVAMDGVVPMSVLLDPRGFKPHSLTSGPYMLGSLPGVSEPGTILVLDADGNQRGKWVGTLTPTEEDEVIRAITGE